MDSESKRKRAGSSGRTGDVLFAEHERLEAVFDGLLGAFAADEREELRRLWNDLDTSLTAHMALEERLIFPAFAKVDPKEVFSLLVEHGDLRRELLEMGVAVDLHMVREEGGRRFIARLRDHARREERLLYRWASENVDPEAAASLLRHLTSQPDQASVTAPAP